MHDNALRLALVAPLFESVPPQLYGGTERVVAYLTEELVTQGHEVTLFASGDSRTRARLRTVARRGLRLDASHPDALVHHLMLLDAVSAAAAEFDVIHFHTDLLHFPLLRRLGRPAVTTLHGRLDLPGLATFYHHFSDAPLVSISHDQRRPLPVANWQATVRHGLPRQLYSFRREPGTYLAFLGRISPEKGPDRAIRIAREAGIPLLIAAKVEAADEAYYREQIVPLLQMPEVEFIGEIDEREKNAFLGGALALLFPIDWPEPFGLVMIEAMACGTPVIAWRCGSTPEVLEQGVSGYLVDNEAEAVRAVALCRAHDRRLCRAEFEERFTAARMARDYVDVYRSLIFRMGRHARDHTS